MGNQLARVAHRTTTDTSIAPSERNDRWLTPLPIVNALGVFDLDPCAAPNHPTATAMWTPENGHDGLEEEWFGRVWMNPPYGRVMRQWVDRLVEHGSGTMLIPVATGTKLWMDAAWPNASAIHFWRHRVKFLRRDGLDDDMVSPAASALVAFGDFDAEALLTSGLPGVALDFRHQAEAPHE